MTTSQQPENCWVAGSHPFSVTHGSGLYLFLFSSPGQGRKCHCWQQFNSADFSAFPGLNNKRMIRGQADFHLLKAGAGRSGSKHPAPAQRGTGGPQPLAPNLRGRAHLQQAETPSCTDLLFRIDLENIVLFGPKEGNLRGEDLSIEIVGFRQLEKVCAFSQNHTAFSLLCISAQWYIF